MLPLWLSVSGSPSLSHTRLFLLACFVFCFVSNVGENPTQAALTFHVSGTLDGKQSCLSQRRHLGAQHRLGLCLVCTASHLCASSVPPLTLRADQHLINSNLTINFLAPKSLINIAFLSYHVKSPGLAARQQS